MMRRGVAWLLAVPLCVTGIAAAAENTTEGTPLRVYHDEIGGTLYEGISYSYDAVPVPSLDTTIDLSLLTAQHYADAVALLSATSWDFSPADGFDENNDPLPFSPDVIAETTVPIDPTTTCNAGRCGFNFAGNDFMSRQDNLNPSRGTLIQAAFDVDVGATMARVWLRAGAQFEGSPSGEQRFCFDGDPDRGQVPQWEFQHQDGARFYMQVGDAWTGTQFNCSANLFLEVCGAPYLGGGKETDGSCDANQGLFTFEVVSEGTITLPSGHQLDALVVLQVADFCVWQAGLCPVFFPVGTLQPVVLFVVPGLGVMAQINGPQQATSATDWDQVTETDIRFGLLPPLSTQVDSVGDTSVTISWDPGQQNGYIDRAKVYWDTDSSAGGGTYAFNSDDQAGQVAFGPGTPPTSATISGLTPGQTYYFTVTFLDNFTQPRHCRGGGAHQGEVCTSDAECTDAGGETCSPAPSPATREYESRLFPHTVSGGGFTYPQEVSAATTNPGCTPTGEVAGLVVEHAGGGDLTFSWDALADACLDHYLLLGSDALDAGSFVEVANTALSTSFTGNPGFLYYLVIAAGAGDQQGPLGHFDP